MESANATESQRGTRHFTQLAPDAVCLISLRYQPQSLGGTPHATRLALSTCRPSQIYTGPDVMLKGPIFTPGEFIITLHREFSASEFTVKLDSSEKYLS